MEHLLDLTTALSVLLIVLVLTSLRRAHIRVEYSVSWLVASAALLFLSRSPGVLMVLGGLLGIPNPPVAMVMIAAGVFLLIFFRFSVIVSHLRDDNIALAQRVAILEFHIQSLRSHGD